MDDQNNGQQPQQPQPAATESPAPEQYTAYAHQIPEHGSPDPAPSVPDQQMPTPLQPAYTPEPAFIPTPSYNEPASQTTPSLSSNDDRPVPVVRVLSVRGIEYAMMSILLWSWSAALIVVLVALINGGASFSQLSFPVSLLIIAMPAFAFFYIRLRRAELRDPSLRLEASKRRFSQITQILAFLTCFFNLVALVAVLMSAAGGNDTTSIPKFIGSTVVVLAVAGGILVYYWFDEHKLVKR